MPQSRLFLCLVYAAVALLALAATWSQNVAYFRADEGAAAGFAMATGRFWKDTLASPASTSITVDLGLLLVPLVVWMVSEARRIGMRFVWLYVIGGMLIAISVTFPLFMIARERRLAAAGRSADTPALGAGDSAGLVALGGVMAAVALWTLAR